MIDPWEVLPVLALALAIVLLPLLGDKPSGNRDSSRPHRKPSLFPGRPGRSAGRARDGHAARRFAPEPPQPEDMKGT
jgi:hypothetical protein